MGIGFGFGFGFAVGGKGLIGSNVNPIPVYNPIDDIDVINLFKTRDNLTFIDVVSGYNATILPSILGKPSDKDETLFYRGTGVFNANTDLSIFGWFKGFGIQPAYACLIGKMSPDSAAGEYGFSLTIDKLVKFVLITDSEQIIIDTTINLNTSDWVHLCATVDTVNKSIKIYVNNVQFGTTITYSGNIPTLPDTYSFTIGAMNNTSLTGYSYSSAIYAFNCGIASRIINSVERTDLYNKKTINDCEGFWPLNITNNSIFYDISGNKRDLTVFNTAGSLIEYYEPLYGSTTMLDNGYSVYMASDGRILTIPNTTDGNTQSIVGHTLIKEVSGDMVNHNLADCMIQFSNSIFDKSNTNLFSNNMRASKYYNTLNRWHISELNRSHLDFEEAEINKNIIFPKIDNNSYNDRISNLEVITFNSKRTQEQRNIINTYTNDSGIKQKIVGGVCLTFDDISRVPGWVKANNTLYEKYQWKATFCINGSPVSSVKNMMDNVFQLMKYGHEISNHSVNHIDWVTYLNTHTINELYNTEIAPQSTILNKYYKINTKTVAMWQRSARDEALFNLIISNGFTYVRPYFTGIPLSMSDVCYDGSSQYNNSISLDTTNFPDTEAGYNLLESYIEYARDNNVILVITGHSIGDTNDFFTVSQERIDRICKYVYDNNMRFYGLSELLPTLF